MSDSEISIIDTINNDNNITLPWHFEKVSSPEISDEEERLIPMTSAELKKKKKEKKEEKILNKEKQQRINKAQRRGEEIGKKLLNKNDQDKDDVDWELSAQTRRIRRKYEDDICQKDKLIWKDILERGDKLQSKIQERMDKEIREIKDKLKRKYEQNNDFKKYAKRIVERAEKDKQEDLVPEKLPLEKEVFLVEKKKEEEGKVWIGRRMRTRQSEFDSNIVGRGIKNTYSISPVRNRPCYVDEKEKLDKLQKKEKIKEGEKLKIEKKDASTNTVISSIVLDRIFENLEEIKEFLMMKPTK